MSEFAGTRLGKYLVDEKMAVGGMAEIYRAHTSLGEPVAIKVIHPRYAQEPRFVQMFLDEAKIAVGLRHTNIVQIFDFGKVGNTYFFAMEWIDGKSLSAVVKRQQELNMPFPIDVALLIVIDILKGLAHAHDRRDPYDRRLGIVHRDVSPPNILVSRNGVSKITDFGIADAEHKTIKTRPGVIRGKFSYMSPEQSRGETVDQRSDIFSSAIVLYELISARRLFLRDEEVETLEAVRKCQVPPFKQFREGVPDSLEKVIRKSLSQQKEKRFSTGLDFAQALELELNKYNSNVSYKTVAQFLKVLFPWETFVGVEEPLKVLLTRWKARQAFGGASQSAKQALAHWSFENRYAISSGVALAAIVLAEWITRTS